MSLNENHKNDSLKNEFYCLCEALSVDELCSNPALLPAIDRLECALIEEADDARLATAFRYFAFTISPRERDRNVSLKTRVGRFFDLLDCSASPKALFARSV